MAAKGPRYIKVGSGTETGASSKVKTKELAPVETHWSVCKFREAPVVPVPCRWLQNQAESSGSLVSTSPGVSL